MHARAPRLGYDPMTSFTPRPAPSVVFVATIRDLRQAPPTHRVEPGDDVKLYAGRVEVFVQVAAIEGEAFVGRVIGTNGHGTTVGDDLAPGAEIRFQERHIYTCSKRRHG